MENEQEPCVLSDLQLMSLYRVRAAIIDFFELARRSDYFVWDTATNLKLLPEYLVSGLLPTRARPDSENFRREDSYQLCRWAEGYVCNVLEKERMFLEKTPVYEQLSHIVKCYVSGCARAAEKLWKPDAETEEADGEPDQEPMSTRETEALGELDEIVEMCFAD